MKKYWNLFLISISVAGFACTEAQYGGDVTYYILNQTKSKISISATTRNGYLYEYNIKAGDTLLYESYDPIFAYKEVNASDAFSGTELFNDSVYIAFDSIKYLSYSHSKNACEFARSVYCMNEYDIEQLGDRHFKFHYTFTNLDFKNATPIE